MATQAPDAGHWLPRMIGRIFLGILALVILGVALLLVSEKWTDYDMFANDMTHYQSVAIGQSKEEVAYALGEPQTVEVQIGPANNGWGPVKVITLTKPFDQLVSGVNETDLQGDAPVLPANQSFKGYADWHYYSMERQLSVRFDKNGTVSSIGCWAEYTNKSRSCDLLMDVSSFTDENGVRSQLGNPSREEVSDGIKTMDYDSLGVHFLLHERTVFAIKKTKPTQKWLFPWWVSHRLI